VVTYHLVRALAPPDMRDDAEGAVVVVDSPRGDAYEVDEPVDGGRVGDARPGPTPAAGRE
jgi:hypothetical protein